MIVSSESVTVLAAALDVETRPVLDMFGPFKELERTGGYKIHEGALNGRALVIMKTGVGADAATRAHRRVHEMFDVGHVIIFGIAGSLTADLRLGCVVAPDRVADVNKPDRALALDPLPPGGDHGDKVRFGGLALQVDRPYGAEDKQMISAPGAVMVDMESYTAALIAREHGALVSVARAISDGPEVEFDHGVDPGEIRDPSRVSVRPIGDPRFRRAARRAAMANAEFLGKALNASPAQSETATSRIP